MKKNKISSAQFKVAKKPVIGTHWNHTGHSKVHQLYRRVEHVAAVLEQRRQLGHSPTKPYIEELFDIANELKMLDMRSKQG